MAPHTSSETSATQSDEVSAEDQKTLRSRRRFFAAWTAVAVILLTVVATYALNILSVPVGIIVWSCIIVFCLRTPVNSLEARGVQRSVGTVLAFVLMFLVLAFMGLMLFSPVFGVGDQFKNLIESIPTYVNTLSEWFAGLYSQYAQFLDNETIKGWIVDVSKSLGSWASDTAKVSAEGIVVVGGTVANSFMVVGFAMVVAFWVLMELPALGRECRRLIGEKHQDDAHMLYITFTRVMGGYIKATVVQCVLIGLVCGIAFAIIGVPNYAALGGITGLLNIIPVVGPWLGGGLAAIVGFFVSPWIALIALIVTIALQQFIYTFVSPKLMADSVDVHPALVFIALFAGSAIGGAMSGFMGSLVGMLASIPAVAAMKAVFVYYFEKKTGRRIVSEDGVFFKGTPSGRKDALLDPIADASSPSGTLLESSEARPWGSNRTKAAAAKKWQHPRKAAKASMTPEENSVEVSGHQASKDATTEASNDKDSAQKNA